MKRYSVLVLTALLLLGLFFATISDSLGRSAAGMTGEIAPSAITPEPPPPAPQPLYIPIMLYTLPPRCLAVETSETMLSPIRTDVIDVRVFTENTIQVTLAGMTAEVDAEGVAAFELEAELGVEYTVTVDGVAAPACTVSFTQTPSWWVGQHGDPYAWVGEHNWFRRDGLIHLFTNPTTEVDLPLDMFTESEANRGVWTYYVQYTGPGMTLYSAMLRPGGEDFQHIYRVVLRMHDGRVLRVRNLGHVISPEETGPLTVDTGPGTQSYSWVEGEIRELNGFDLEFVRTETHNGIHQAVLVTIAEDNSQWIFTRELNGFGANYSARLDGRLVTPDIDQVGGVFGQLLRDEPIDTTRWVVGVVEDGLPGTLDGATATAQEITVLDAEQWGAIADLFSDDW
jgi:hypothetical protein